MIEEKKILFQVESSDGELRYIFNELDIKEKLALISFIDIVKNILIEQVCESMENYEYDNEN